MADATFKQKFLDDQNRRRQHGSPVLMYSDKLCEDAQKRANDLLRNDRENVCSCNCVKSTRQGKAAIKDFVACKSTTELGVGLATDGNTKFIVVGQYKPSGNTTYTDYYEKNV